MGWRKVTGGFWKLNFVGKGRSGLVMELDENRVIKAPIIYNENDPTNPDTLIDGKGEGNIHSLENEKLTMERLGHHPDIVEWHEFRRDGIVMTWMENGPLDEYRSKTELLLPQHIYDWIFTTARAIAYCHSRMVIICDVASRNILVDEHERVKLCDFSESAVLSLDTLDIAEESVDGCTIQTDIFEYGRVVYEIVTGEEYRYDIFFPDKDEFEKAYPERLAARLKEEAEQVNLIERDTDEEVAAGMTDMVTQKVEDTAHTESDNQAQETSQHGRDPDTSSEYESETSKSRPRTIGFTADLPSVYGLPYGDIMWKCWTRQYRDMTPVLEDIQNEWERLGKGMGITK